MPLGPVRRASGRAKQIPVLSNRNSLLARVVVFFAASRFSLRRKMRQSAIRPVAALLRRDDGAGETMLDSVPADALADEPARRGHDDPRWRARPHRPVIVRLRLSPGRTRPKGWHTGCSDRQRNRPSPFRKSHRVPSCRPFGTVAYRGRCVNADLGVAARRSLARSDAVAQHHTDAGASVRFVREAW